MKAPECGHETDSTGLRAELEESPESKQESQLSLAPLRTLASMEDMGNRSSRILKALEKAIEAYSRARIHLTNLEVEETKIAETNHTQETIAREMLAQGDHYIEMIGSAPSYELGMDTLSDLALTYIKSYNAGIDAYEAKCEQLGSDVDEVARLALWCAENARLTDGRPDGHAVVTPSTGIDSRRTIDARPKIRVVPVPMISRIRRRESERSQTRIDTASVNSIRPAQAAENQHVSEDRQKDKVARAGGHDGSDYSLQVPRTLGDIFSYAIAQR